MTNATSYRRLTSRPLSAFCVAATVAGILVGLAGTTVATTAVRGRVAVRPRTLVAAPSKILAFAQDGGRIAWIGRGRETGCRLYVRALGGSRTVAIALSDSDCADLLPGSLALGGGSAAWAEGTSCMRPKRPQTCHWRVETVAAGGSVVRVVARDHGANYVKYNGGFYPPPRPLLAGAGRLLVYAGPRRTDSIVQGRARPLFREVHVYGLAVGGGQIATASYRYFPGDGCGCLEAPAWSPDGSKIAVLEGHFVPDHQTTVHVAVMNADGSGRHRLAPATVYLSALQSAVPPNSLSWSPDGKHIAYDGAGPAGDEIGIVKVDGSSHSLLGQGGSPAWSPDGTKIAFIRQSDSDSGIFVMSPDGTSVHEVASLGANVAMGPGTAWSPDGTKIAFSAGSPPIGWQPEVMNADGTNVHVLDQQRTGDTPTWSPDGSHIAYHNQWDGKIWLIGADGSGATELTHHFNCCDHPSWSPDGTTIAFGRTTHATAPHREQPGREIYTADAGGGNVRPLTFTRAARWALNVALHSAAGRPGWAFSVPLPYYGVQTIALAHGVAAVGSHFYSPQFNLYAEITLTNTRTRRRIASVRLTSSYAADLSVVGGDAHWVVFKLGNTISALEDHTRQVVLTKLRLDPLGLSVSGHRVAWAENINGHGRIRALELPT